MNRSASLASIESFTSAIDSIEHVELIPIDSSTDAILDEKHDSMIKPESDGKKSNAFKDHKCCLLIATVVFIVILCIFFIIIYSNRSEPTREYSSVSENCANCLKENKTEENDFSSKEVKNTELQVTYTLWGPMMTFMIQTHNPVSLVLSKYDEETTLMICRNNRTSYELFCDSRKKHNCPYVPVNKSVTIRNETETKDEQIIVDIVTKCIDQKFGIKWDM
ncbi:Hypothetical predicted protein [Mytilus galloprovincialis]|uniref:Uncharacterized protein n=1 Tax=Mytilus galloprovincialis TaxID=29158 RepID=A0A8B6EG40_MYTGA|nr:Hypothetical predicted protein [Mytilus galloprovincialis]